MLTPVVQTWTCGGEARCASDSTSHGGGRLNSLSSVKSFMVRKTHLIYRSQKPTFYLSTAPRLPHPDRDLKTGHGLLMGPREALYSKVCRAQLAGLAVKGLNNISKIQDVVSCFKKSLNLLNQQLEIRSGRRSVSLHIV